MERVAKSEYTRGNERSPINCSLFYLALRQRTVLRNLWRLASSHPEQRTTYKLLSNDFDEPRWQGAALKNAYALLSKRRYRKSSSTRGPLHFSRPLCRMALWVMQALLFFV